MTLDPAVEGAVDRVAELLGRHIGLRQESNLRGRLRRCVRDEAVANGETVDAYVDQLTSEGRGFQSLLNQVTVQESSFFRHPEQFAALARDILPSLTQPITIWSAGCANGQEAFSLAMVLEELHLDGTIIATDLSTSAVERTRNGFYTTRELTGLSTERINRHLTQTADAWQVNPNIRARLTTGQHNLVEPFPAQVQCSQVVFCRNVLIYFAPDHARAFLDRVADTMPAAVVFLGSAETMWSVTDRFETIRSGDSYYYRRRTPIAPQSNPGPRTRQTIASGAGGSPPARPISGPAGVRHAPGRQSQDQGTTLVRAGRPAGPAPVARPTASRDDDVETAVLTRLGQQALGAGDHQAAVVVFRKCTYLTPDDALAHLHLGLAFEASGDNLSALRAYANARQTIVQALRAGIQYAIGGYTTAELIGLLDAKQEGLTP